MIRKTNSSLRKLLLTTIASATVLLVGVPQAVAQDQWDKGDEWRAPYKVGDLVQFSISGRASDFQKCKVSNNEPGFPMRVQCDAFKQWTAGSYVVYGKGSIQGAAGIADKAKNNATPEKTEEPAQDQAGGLERPDEGECQFNEPAGTTSRNTKASEQLFQRVIYERYRDMESGRKVGVTFKTFTLNKSFVNRLTGSGLLHDGAPQGVMVYRYKTDFFTCVKYTDSILRTDVQEGYFACFKDKSGEWACAEDGRRNWSQKHLAVK
jgi:hypothetical protein